MAYEIPILDDTFAAAGPIIQYRVVTLGTGGIKMSTSTPVLARVVGVSQMAGTTANPLTNVAVRCLGITKCEASTAALARSLTRGEPLMTRETVPRPTPARTATSSKVGRPLCRPLMATAASRFSLPRCRASLSRHLSARPAPTAAPVRKYLGALP